MTIERTIKIRVTSKKAEKDLKSLNKQIRDLGKESNSIGKGFKASGGIVTSVLGGITKAATATAAAIIAVAVNSAKSQKELKILSDQAKTSVGNFKALAFAAEQYGVTGEQVADISKDISDKLGEFATAGTGPFQDYADVMKLSKEEAAAAAKEFQHMSSEEVIGKMISQMEGANATGAQMTFVLESMGNDLSKLAPLFRENSAELNTLKKRYKDATDTLQLTKDEAAELAKLSGNFNIFTEQLSASTTSISASLAPALNSFFESVIEKVPQATKAIKDFIDKLYSIETANLQDESTNNLIRTAQIEKDLIKLKEDGVKALKEFGETESQIALTQGTNAAKRSVELKAELDQLKARRIELDKLLGITDTINAAQGGGNKSPVNESFIDRIDKNNKGSGGGDKKKEPSPFAGIQKRLELETQIMQERADLMSQFREGELNQQQLAFEMEMAQIKAQNEIRRQSIMENERLTGEERKALKEEIQIQENIALKNLKDQQKENDLQNAKDSVMGALSLFASGSKKAFEIKKKVALTETLISGYQAATDAWAAGMALKVPYAPAVAAAYTAASLLKTGAQYKAIKSTCYGGGGSGTSSGGGSGASASIGGGAASGGDSIAQRPDVLQRNIGVESTELTKLRNELQSYDDDDVLPIRFVRRLANSFDETISSGTVTSDTIGGN